MANITPTGRKWWAYSKKNEKFDAFGFTKAGGDCEKDAIDAMELLAKHLKESIPADVEFVLLGTDQ